MKELVTINGYTFNNISIQEFRKIYKLIEKNLSEEESEQIIDFLEQLGKEREKLIEFARLTAKVFTEDIKIERK